MIEAGAINAWNCPDCKRNTVAIHVDEGVTPMFLRCRRTEGCNGMASSAMYPDPPIPEHIIDALEWEWYKPADADLQSLDSEMRDHVDRGGLILRPLSDAGRALVTGLT